MLSIKDIKELIETIDKTEIQNFEMEDGNSKIKISKNAQVIQAQQPSAVVVQEAQNPATSLIAPAQAAKVEPEPKEVEEDLYIVKSPIVGTFYESSSPGSPAFASVGSKVSKGDTLCIIEAMKIMNEIECEEDGEVVEILVKNEDIVEYGQPLMKIRRS